MKTIYRHLFVLLTLIIQLQLLVSYPSSNANYQRTFLRCQFSAVACKRSLSVLREEQNSLSMIKKIDFQACLNQNRPVWFCLIYSRTEKLEEMKHDY